MGTSTFLKQQNKNIQIIGAQPEDGSRIPGIRKWSPDYVPSIFNRSKVDQVLEVSQSEATKMTQRLAKEEGIFAGMSSGGSLATALKLIETIDKGIVVAIVCDRGDRYLSSSLFDTL
jgi:cysteine synthase B